MAKRSFKVTVTNLPCSCGGVLRPHKVSGDYDVSAELGLPALVGGRWMAVRCDKCGRISVPGRMLEELSDEVVLLLLRLERRLSGAEAKFLRKAALGAIQDELAVRLGVTRVTVARWESEQSLSPEHDFQLRALVVAHLLSQGSSGAPPWKRRHTELLYVVTRFQTSARSAEAPRTPRPLRIERRAA